MKRIITIIAAISATLALASCDNAEVETTTSETMSAETLAPTTSNTPSYANTTELTAGDKITITNNEQTTASTTEPVTVTEVIEDLTTIPEISDLMASVSDRITNAKSFEITCSLKGNIPETKSAIAQMINHKFVYTVSGDNSHLFSEFEDLNIENSRVEYEEYQKLEDNIVTTITKHDDNWVDNTPKEMIRYSMQTKALNSIGLVSIINNAPGEIFDKDEYISRDENGNYIITMPAWYNWTSSDEKFTQHAFSGLMRAPSIEDSLYSLNINEPEGNIVYTINKDFYLTAMSFDIIMPQAGSYDLHCELTFDKWDDIPRINVPEPVKITTTETTEENTTE